MSVSVIRTSGLGKRYQLGERRAGQSVKDAVGRVLRRSDEPPRSSFWALRDVSFDVHEGEVVGIIGRNGAGKSTLLKVLSRITYPTEGRAEIRGRVGSLLEVGTGFHPELTGRENVYLNGAILGMRSRELQRKFTEIVEFAEIETFIDTPVKRYSSGMYVRLAFAVAAHLEPEVLLVDEVLSVGDIAFQRKCLGKIEEVAHQQRTVLFVSHQIDSIQQLCQRVLLLASGQVQAFGPTQDVIGAYLSDAASSSDGDFDLSAHPTRAVHHAPVIRRLRLYADDGTMTTRYGPHDPMVAEILVEPPHLLREPIVGIGVSDHFGRRIFTVASFFEPEGLEPIKDLSLIRCRIPELRLGSGRYLLSVSVQDRYHGELDGLENIAEFEVYWQNSYGTGEPYRPVFGPVLSSSRWERLDP
ncbi:MAG: ABC transporter ATP-binding protein [Actinomycetota bacterium]|nr:ABC transporter ATP-binding protein [Actinomycetota bacterium]